MRQLRNSNHATPSTQRRLLSERLSERAALCQHAHEQALALEAAHSDARGWERECEAAQGAYTDRIVAARAAMNEELAAVRAEAEAARRGGARATALHQQAERQVPCLLASSSSD